MSDEQTTPKRGRPPKITVAPRTTETAFSTDDIIARRLSGDPYGTREAQIPLKEAGKWAIKEANSLADENRHFNIVHKEGWIPLTVNDLADGITPDSLGYLVSPEGTLCRGKNGDERLYKMTVENRQRVAMAKKLGYVDASFASPARQAVSALSIAA